ncbi:MAG: ATP-binding protein [Planctomycetia bacterium]|nr:ATP-binding protein [Planctomycetia bacterium]
MTEKKKQQKLKFSSLNIETSNWNLRQNPFSVCFVQPGSIPFVFERSYLNLLKKKSPLLFQQYLFQALSIGNEVRTFVGTQFLTDSFERLGYRAQIVGDHGTGKSTLLHYLADSLSARGHQVFSFSLHDSQRNLPQEFWSRLNKVLGTLPSDESNHFFKSETVQISNEQIRYSSSNMNHSDKTSPKTFSQKIVFLDGFEQLSYFSRYLFRSFCRKHRLGFLLSTHSSAVAVPVLFRTHSSFETVRKIIDFLLDDSDFFLFESEIRALMKQSGNNIRQVLFDLYDEYENHLDALQ